MTDSMVSWLMVRGVLRSQLLALLSTTGSGTTSGQWEERLRPSADTPSPSWSFWNTDAPRCWSSVPAASRAAGGDTGIASRRGRGGRPCSSRQVGGAWACVKTLRDLSFLQNLMPRPCPSLSTWMARPYGALGFEFQPTSPIVSPVQ